MTQWTVFISILAVVFALWAIWSVDPAPYLEHDHSEYRQGVGERLMKEAGCQDYWEIGIAAKALGLAASELRPTLDYFVSHGWVDARWAGAGEQMKREYFVTPSGARQFSAPSEPVPTLQPTSAVQ